MASTAEVPEAQRVPADREPQWPAVFAFVTAWLLPATTGRRTARVHLAWAFLVHLVTVIVAPVLIACFIAWEEADRRGSDFFVLIEEGIGGLIRECSRYPEEFLLGTAGVLLSIEGTFFVVALLLVSWGARDERVRTSFANSLRQTWLHTPHVLLVILAMLVLTLTLSRVRSAWWEGKNQSATRFPAYPTPPTQPATTQATRDYQAAMQKYNEQASAMWEEQRRRQPWYVAYGEMIIGYAGFAGATWFLWALLRGVGARRDTPPIARAPTCEACGYNLTHAVMEGRCPECGTPVVDSFGPNVRPGSPWQRRREVGFCRAWWRCCIDPILRPKAFGRQVRLASPGTDHRWFFATHLVLIFLIGAAGMILCYAIEAQRSPFLREPEMVWIVWGAVPLVGYFSALLVLAFIVGGAGLVGMGYRVSDRRNLMAGAMQIACFLSGYLVLWAALAAGGAAMAFALNREPVFREIVEGLHMDCEVAAFFLWFIPNAVCAGLYLMLVSRGTAGTRYANR